MEMKITLREGDLSDDYLRFAHKIGADGLDIHSSSNLPGVRDNGRVDPSRLQRLKARLRTASLDIFRVSPPTPVGFLKGQPGGEEEVDELCRTIRTLGEASVPIVATPVHLGENSQMTTQEQWSRAVQLYELIVPVAEEAGVRLALHPTDPPVHEAPFSPLRWRRMLDAVPSRNSGLLYCVGTCCESGVDVIQDIQHYGRKGKIFHVHFRNVRGSLPTAGTYEEVPLDDGDMSMFHVLQTLWEVGYDGALNPDHPTMYPDDAPNWRIDWAYSVGYMKALLAALR